MKHFIKKIFITLAIFLAAALPVFTLNAPSAFAYPASDCNKYDQNSAAYQSCIEGADRSSSDTLNNSSCRYFLGLVAWDCGVDIKDEASLKSGIWIIVGNISTDLTVIAAYLIIGYVIYGGYLYIFSGGAANKVADGKKTLYHAFLGLAIVMSANVVMNSIRIALLGGSGRFTDCATTSCVDASSVVTNAIQWVIGIAGIVAAIFVVYGGISYITSNGDPGKLQTAKRMIIYALIGLVIVAIAEIITSFVSTTIRDANKTSRINDNYISKEVYENYQV